MQRNRWSDATGIRSNHKIKKLFELLPPQIKEFNDDSKNPLRKHQDRFEEVFSKDEWKTEIFYQDDFVPAGALPEDSILVVRACVLQDFEQWLTAQNPCGQELAKIIEDLKNTMENDDAIIKTLNHQFPNLSGEKIAAYLWPDENMVTAKSKARRVQRKLKKLRERD